MAQRETWLFTTTDRRTGRTAEVRIEARRPGDVIDALARLKAPVKTIGLVRRHGVGMVRRFSWTAGSQTVAGVRA